MKAQIDCFYKYNYSGDRMYFCNFFYESITFTKKRRTYKCELYNSKLLKCN